jgi:hypothetical protein
MLCVSFQNRIALDLLFDIFLRDGIGRKNKK